MKHIKFVTIDESILRHTELTNDTEMKLILGYIHYRLKLDGYEWTFSQSEIQKQLGFSQKMVNRRIKELIEQEILVCGHSIKCATGSYIPMTVNEFKLNEFIKRGQVKVTVASNKVILGLSQGDLGGKSQCLRGAVKVTEGVSQGDYYNKNIANKNTQIIISKEESKTDTTIPYTRTKRVGESEEAFQRRVKAAEWGNKLTK